MTLKPFILFTQNQYHIDGSNRFPNFDTRAMARKKIYGIELIASIGIILFHPLFSTNDHECMYDINYDYKGGKKPL